MQEGGDTLSQAPGGPNRRSSMHSIGSDGGAPNEQWRGGDRSGLRQYNERIIVQVIRRVGARPKAEIARITGLSPQTVSVLVNRMLADGLLIKAEKLRGKVGQPSTLICLNPDGAYSVGVKIGRRTLDVLLMGLDGRILRRIRHAYPFPLPQLVFGEVERGIALVCENLTECERRRLLGVGVCAPSRLHGWAEELEASPESLAEWRDIDITKRIAAMVTLPVFMMNDVAAATAAELALGTAINKGNCLYIYLGAFVGGGLVMSGKLVTGPHANAGAIGSLPLSGTQDIVDGRKPQQLIRHASLLFLERELARAGFELDKPIDVLAVPDAAAAIYEAWRREAVAALAYAIGAAISIFDFELVVIDGSLERREVERITGEVNEALDTLNLSGLVRPQIALGTLGSDARALGAGLMPINANFEPDQDLMLKLAAETV
jgi:predicted NBD/HSP70 family sugar kinase